MRSSVRAALLAVAVLGSALAAAPAQALVSGPAHTVYGGTPATASDYPWLAAIGTPIFPLRPGGNFCGGVLITPDEVLTAAHCAAVGLAFPHLITVTFGRSNLESTEGTTAHVTEIRMDPRFRAGLFDDGDVDFHHDVAILRLDRTIPGPTAPVGTAHGSTATVLGWGATETDDGNPLLRSATVPLLAEDGCASYGTDFDPATQLCAGSTTADTAEYDSGGPILVDGKVVGLCAWSHGIATPGYPTIYSRVPTDVEF
ncbi:S1 family peptidase [Nocardia stercoris]|uniref:Serine protease n=1 Tax=Nocardia stercoris TaxID=2483361 RepID=A0A3M2KXV6_9NOCA|nr:serine protease [Nocardia stercoris]RMI30349.1 serine protease [Nocardia stercoris]